MASNSDLIELSRHLKQERLFVSAEREQLQSLNVNVAKGAEKLYHASWIARQQKTNLGELILASKNATPEACCRKANCLELVNFVDGYKCLSYHESKIGEFLKALRENPKLLSSCLVQAEKSNVETMQAMTRIIMSSIYGNTVMPEDEMYILHVLKALIELQISVSDNPRRLLRKGSCAFSIVFKLFNEGLFSAKLFLTAALHKPVMQLLMEDEWFYDIDAERALYRFPPAERQRRFGQQGTDDYDNKTGQYREVTTNKLAMLVERFINGIKSNMYCFPPSLAWCVSQLYHTVTKAQTVNVTEAKAMCADLVLACFICPAICDPEPYGITSDAPISYIARHNLMQVAQVLQVLAISSWEEVDSKSSDLYSKFEKGCMSFLLDALLDTPCTDQPPSTSNQLIGYRRAAILLTCTELTELLNFLRNLISTLAEGSDERKQLEALISNVPPASAVQAMRNSYSPNTTPQATPPGTPGTTKKIPKGGNKKRVFLTPEAFRDRGDEDTDTTDAATVPPVPEDVLVVSLGVHNECPGMLTENKVLETDRRQRKSQHNSILPGEDDPVSESEIHLHEKRTRFSLSHDQDSIATSDNLEAISEAASSHSVGSDLDNENDNLSDMVSANVSGRGTPNISGRDTPLSQAESQVEGPEESPRAPDLPVMVQKTNREDVTDRFGKFEIKQELERDETKSTVSDTWSTDVLASDSEPPEQSQLERLEEVAEEMARHNLLGVAEAGIGVSEMSETASDAWSTDVLASDTSERQSERLLELDQDDLASVSSRGQGPDEQEAEEPLEGNEDTPQASGNQSPRDSDDPSGGAVGGPAVSEGRGRLFTKKFRHRTKHIPRPAVDNYRQKPECEQDEDSGGDPFANSDEEEFKPRYMENDYHSNRGNDQLSNQELNGNQEAGSRNQARGRGRHGNAECGAAGRHGNIDSAGAGHLGNTESSGPGVRRRGLFVFDDKNVPSRFDSVAKGVSGGKGGVEGGEGGHLGSSVQTLVPETLASPMDPLPEAMTRSDEGTLRRDDASQDGRARQLTSGHSRSIDSLTRDFNGLKLTEQQNFNIDANRLSAAVEYFDPLSESSTDPTPDENLDSLTESCDLPSESTPVFVNANYAQQGAKPKVPQNGGSSSMPRISVHQVGETDHRPRVQFQTIENNKDRPPEGATKAGQPNGDVVMKESSSIERSNGGRVDSSMPVWSEATTSSPARPETGSGGGSTGNQGRPDKAEDSKDSEDDKKQDKKKSTGFFHSFKERLSKGGKRKGGKPYEKDELGRLGDSEKGTTPEKPQPLLVDIDGTMSKVKGQGGKTEEPPAVLNESSDDILAKYRKPASSPTKSADGASLPAANQVAEKEVSGWEEEEDASPMYDPNNLETCKAFMDAKKKLRLVLSTADFQTMPMTSSILGSAFSQANNDRRENELISFLKVQLAEAINLQDKDLIAQLHETIRCLRQFDRTEIKKLLKTMKEEYRSRSPYIAYLVRCRQGLLSTLAHLDRLYNRVQRDKLVCNKYFLSVFVRLFLEKHERSLMKFIAEFQKLTLSDEKTELVDQFLNYLHRRMEEDSSWQAATECQMDEAGVYIERNIMSHIYTHAMYPNGDGDIMRDQILHEHMRKLSLVIAPSHNDLKIPTVYHYECPWPAAQAEIYMINAYKTPKDKLQCVLRCSSTIMNLLSMANEKSVPAADDFMPVLIYVLIKANCQSLLSTIQYVNSFYDKRLCGEEQYWWLQFTSAVEFIKTMDYTE